MKPASSLGVGEAIVGRRSVRAFLPQAVDLDVVRRVLEQAGRAPSGGNLQPWHLTVLSGARLEGLKALMKHRVQELPEGEGKRGDGVDFDIYPAGMTSPYRERRGDFGTALYGSMGIPREDAAARRDWHERNFQFFGAPVGLFCHVERSHGKPQWSDLGMYLMSVMLLLREQGLESCPQECWARYARTADNYLQPRAGLMLFCGMSIGYADWTHPANRFPSERAAPGEFLRFLD